MQKLNLRVRKLLLNKWFYYISAFLALIYTFIYISIPRTSIYKGHEESFNGILSSYKIDGDKLSIVLDAKEDLKCNYYFKTKSEKDEMLNSLKLGSRVMIKGNLSIPKSNTVPNTFNYKEYLYNHNIFYICSIKEIKIDSNNINIFYKIKNGIMNRINSFDTTSSYLLTFILGDKSLLDHDVFKTYRLNGITHLFAISGMHIGLFAGLLLFIFKKLGIKETKRYVFTITFIWFYAFLTGYPPSILRAGLLFTLLALNKNFYTEVKSINVLVMTGIILVFINPFILKDIGFIYSFLTTFGLMYASNELKNHKIIGTSIIAFFSSLPITINNFYEFNILSILLNVIIVPFVSVIIYPLCLLTFILPFLEPLTHTLLNILEWFSLVVSQITLFRVITPPMSTPFTIIYYIFFISLINKRFKLTILLLYLIIFINSHKSILDNSTYVDFLDVGQGDSALIRYSGNSNVVLIDTGGTISQTKEKWQERSQYNIIDNTITYLKSLGINKITALVLTHGDADHMGEAINLVNNFKVEKVIFNCGGYNNLEKELIKVLDKKKILYYSCIKELNIDNKKIYFLQTEYYDNENDNSNVIYTELNGYKFMFMGDASVTTEKEILNKYNLTDIDVLKVGHHGSKTSSGKEFIDEINPEYSIISVGKNNRYGHPNKEVLNNLDDSKIYRTDQDGSIMFKIKNNKLKIETCSP